MYRDQRASIREGSVSARVVTGALKSAPINKLYEETGWQTLAKRREYQKLILMFISLY